MRFRRHPDRPGPRFSRLARLAGVTAVAASSTIGLLAATQSAAHAYGIGLATNTLIISNSSWLNVAVRGGSTSAGTDIIQWPSTLGTEQRWNDLSIDGNTYVHYLQNVNSGMCVTTDGVAGDPLFQEPCDPNNTREQWVESYVWWAAGYTLYNPSTGLNWDVQGFSYWAGAEIDGWYPNNQLNQVFS